MGTGTPTGGGPPVDTQGLLQHPAHKGQIYPVQVNKDFISFFGSHSRVEYRYEKLNLIHYICLITLNTEEPGNKPFHIQSWSKLN